MLAELPPQRNNIPYGIDLTPRLIRSEERDLPRLDDVVLSAFLTGPGATTMPLVIFSRARLGMRPDINAAATIIIGVVSVGVIAGSILIARAERRRAAEMAAAQRS